MRNTHSNVCALDWIGDVHTGCLEKSIQFSATCPSPALGSIGRWIMTSKVDCTLALHWELWRSTAAKCWRGMGCSGLWKTHFFLNTLYTSATTKTIFFLWFSFQCSHKKVLCFDLILDTGSNCVRDLRGERRHRATGQVSLEPSRSPSKCRGMSSLLSLSSWSISQFFFFLSTFIIDSVTYLWPILFASFLCSCNYKYRYFFL